MRNVDLVWVRSFDDSGARAFWYRWVQPPGRRINPVALRVYCAGMRVHRWLWVHGVEL